MANILLKPKNRKERDAKEALLVISEKTEGAFRKSFDVGFARNSTIHKGKRKKACPAKPKKRQKHEWLKVYRDGREVLNLDTAKGRFMYGARIHAMVCRQDYMCSLGEHIINDPTFEHEDLRGMGGARRDDRIEKDGKPYNSAACFTCNGEKGSRRDV